MESSKINNEQKMGKLEIEQGLLDKQLYRIDLEVNRQYLNMDGQLVDKKTQMQVEAQAGIDLAE